MENGNGKPTVSDFFRISDANTKLLVQVERLQRRVVKAETALANTLTGAQARDVMAENADLREMNRILLARNEVLNRKMREHLS